MIIGLFTGILILTSISSQIYYSEQYKGGWIYRILPLEDLSEVVKASFKTVFIILLLPVYLLVSCIFYILFGYKVLTLLVFGGLILFLINLISMKIYGLDIPFSKDMSEFNKSGSIVAVFVNMALLVGLGIVSIIVSKEIIPTIIFGFILLAVDVLLYKMLLKLSWEELLKRSNRSEGHIHVTKMKFGMGNK